MIMTIMKGRKKIILPMVLVFLMGTSLLQEMHQIFQNSKAPNNMIDILNVKPSGKPQATYDGKYLFLTSRGEIFWVDAKIIEEMRPKSGVLFIKRMPRKKNSDSEKI